MAAWSSLPPNTTCRQLIHPWTSSCTLSTIDLALAASYGSTIFYIIHLLFDQLIKRAKHKNDFIIKNDSLQQFLKDFFCSAVLFGIIMGSVTLATSCLIRNILGVYFRPLTVFIPGCFGGLGILNLDPKTRILYSSFFANNVMSIVLRRLKGAGRLKLSLKEKTIIFMIMSSTISGLRKVLENDGSQYQFYWFFNPLSHKAGAGANEKGTECYHKNSCKEHIFKDGLKNFSNGLILPLTKIIFKHGTSMLFDRQILLQCLIDKNTYMMGIFMGLYAVIYQTTRCYLYRTKRESTSMHNVIAGFLAGILFPLQPSDTLFNFSIMTVVQILTRAGSRKGCIPNWPFVEIVFALSNGFLYDSAVISQDCSHLINYIINTATKGRANYYSKNYTKIIARKA